MMLVKQISVFVENQKGKLVEITQTLNDCGIDIHAISIADTTDFGILRLIVNQPDKAYQAIKEAGYTVSETEVMAVELEDEPGALHNILNLLSIHEISIEYLYSFIKEPSEKALILLRVEEPNKAIDILTENNVRVLSQKEVYGI